jgi:pimeloyl-ACP methyl ester carboxylesterase
MIDCFIEGAPGRLHYLDYNRSEVTPEMPDVFNVPAQEPERPALILLPGLTNHAHYWDEIAPFFLDNYKVYALDWRGHGDSAPAPTYGYADYAEDITHLVNFLVPEDYYLVGHSLGGYVALFYAAALPEPSALAGIVAADVKTASTEEEHDRSRQAAARPQPFFKGVDEVAARLKAAMPDSSLSEERLRQLAETSVNEEGPALRLKYDRQVLDFEPVDPYSFAEKVGVPVLILNGENSTVMNTKQGRDLTRALPQAKRHEIAEAGHFLYLDRPAEFAGAVSDFLSKLAGKKA